MKIGNYSTKGNVFLAPMAGITDLPFRLMCHRYGAPLVYTEMINAKALCYEDEHTWKMLEVHRNEGDVAIQIFGSESEFIAEAVKIVESLDRFVLIDINMGCPAPKVIKNGDGSALMKDLNLASRIIESAKRNTDLPITVKFRKGWDSETINAVEFALMAQDSGADAVTIHGRTREEFYSGKADWQIIKKVKESLSIPVIGNGDIVDRDSYLGKLRESSVDAVMIGRGAQGNPFLFRDILLERRERKENRHAEIYRVIKEHYNLEVECKGESRALREMRKHIGWYIKSLPMSSKIRHQINGLLEKRQVLDVLEEYFEHLTEMN